MSLPKLKSKAIKLRQEGYSYSQIKKELAVSKSTLSLWLRNYPLTEERIRELRDNNQTRIERCRETKEKNRQNRLSELFKKIEKEIGVLSTREKILCGICLYWAEGTKISSSGVIISNTDFNLIKFFCKTLVELGVKKEKIFVRLQLYKDMDTKKEMKFWSKVLNIKIQNFKRAYIKKTNQADLNYKTGFGHGTCSLIVYDVKLYNYIISMIKYLSISTV